MLPVNTFVLGSNGFVGKHILKELSSITSGVFGLDIHNFNFNDMDSFKVFNFSDSVIIDCITINNGNKEEIEQTNNKGLFQFIDYLKNNHTNFKYIYFSTTTSHLKYIRDINFYVYTKYVAEQYIKSKLTDYKIIRLTFPIGKGENPERLFSKLINKIKNDEAIEIQDIQLNLTPINFLTDNLTKLLFVIPDKEIIFTDGIKHKLKDIVNFIYTTLNKEANYKLSKPQTADFLVENNFKFQNNHSIYDTINSLIS